MIKIITFHISTNYGALLQSLSLKEFIENETKQNVRMCSYHPNKLLFAEFIRPLITKKFTKFERTIKKNFNIYLWKKKAFHTNNYNINLNLNVNVFGSDEIWNYSNPYHGYDPYFFGEGFEKKKIAYAASIGKSNHISIDLNLKKQIFSLLSDFDKISVRDENTSNFITDLIGVKPEFVLDPTLIYTPKILGDKKFISSKVEKNYCIVYGTVFSKNQQDLIYDFCKKRNLQIISVGYYNKWIQKNHLELNPTNFIDYIKNASFIFTSMFHGVMFSVKYSKQFVFSPDPIRKNKISTFLNIFNLNNRIFEQDINESFIDYEILKSKLNPYILSSQKFLTNNLN